MFKNCWHNIFKHYFEKWLTVYVNNMFNISSNLLTDYKHVFEVICHNFGNQYINCDINLQQTNDISYNNTHAYSINLIEQVFAIMISEM